MRPTLAALLLAFATTLLTRVAEAQGGLINGAVEDSAGAPIPQVSIGIVGTGLERTTDARGTFRFVRVRPGVHFVRVRRLGYDPLIFRVDVEDGDTVSLGVQLNPSPLGLAPVTIREDATAPTLRNVGFDDRRRFSGAPAAQFVTRSDIERRNPTELSQMLRRMGQRAAECRNPVIYVDGSLMSLPPQDDPLGLLRELRSDSVQKIGAPAPRATQLSQIPPAWIEGMEVYAGPSEIPAKYNASGRGATCVILLWLR